MNERTWAVNINRINLTNINQVNPKDVAKLHHLDEKLKPLFSINDDYARIEGEGDKSLAYWKQTHWEYYTRELAPFNRTPKESMIVVCEEFEKVF